MRILIAEDDDISRATLSALLKKNGHEVLETVNGAEAWQELQKVDAPRLAIIDLMMPEMNGLEVVRRVRALENGKTFYLIILTAMDEAHDIIVGLDAGADDYLPKPYNIGILGARINVGRRMIEMQEQEVLHQLQLNQAQKMESVGRLAGGVAHDFNNKLAVIIGYVELILMKMSADSPFLGNLMEIRKAAESSADLTRQLLSFARKQTVAPKVLDLNETVAGMLKMLRRLIGEDINLSWQPGTGLLQIKMDPSQIDQILANLCVNARDAIDGVGRITIGTELATLDSNYCAINAEFTPGDYVLLIVSDTGCGMDTETQTNIFEPFFTTKEIGQGTGLGLASVYGAVKQNNGFIKVYSEPGHGTTFRIYLPRYQGNGGEIQMDNRTQSIARGSETILLVEDDASILAVTTILLEGFGYRVLAANTAGVAIQLAREHSGEISLLMTDVIMPEMNGRDLARNLLSLRPGIKRLFMSGYTADIIASQGMLDAGVNFIQKPFSMETLAAKVREVLDKE